MLSAKFVLPLGTGCTRYVKCLKTDDGLLATWQQAQPNASPPPVAHFPLMSKVERILTP